jgi:Tfp pilus assembly protein PilO
VGEFNSAWTFYLIINFSEANIMSLKPSSKRAFGFLIGFLFLIIALVSYNTLIKPEIDSIFAARGELRARTVVLEDQKRINEQVRSVLNRFNSIDALEDIVSMAIPVDEDLSALLNQLNVLSRTSGLRPESVSFRSLSLPESRSINRGTLSTNKAVSAKGIVEASLSLTGTYNSFKSFVRLLETNVRVIDLKTLSIAPVNRESAQDFYKYDLIVSAYFQVGDSPR